MQVSIQVCGRTAGGLLTQPPRDLCRVRRPGAGPDVVASGFRWIRLDCEDEAMHPPGAPKRLAGSASSAHSPLHDLALLASLRSVAQAPGLRRSSVTDARFASTVVAPRDGPVVVEPDENLLSPPTAGARSGVVGNGYSGCLRGVRRGLEGTLRRPPQGHGHPAPVTPRGDAQSRDAARPTVWHAPTGYPSPTSQPRSGMRPAAPFGTDRTAD